MECNVFTLCSNNSTYLQSQPHIHIFQFPLKHVLRDLKQHDALKVNTH